MSRTSSVQTLLVIVILAAVLVGGVAVWWLVFNNHPDNNTTIPPATTAFQEAAKEANITFRMNFLPNEQGEKFKINLYDHGTGVAIGDFDADGYDDIYFVNQLGANALYRNKHDGTFEDVTKKARVGLGDRVCVSAAWGDTLNKGRQDLYVTSTRGGNVFFRNNGDGTFTDATKEAGLTLVRHSQTAVFFDYDNDGFLDLFVTNSAEWTLDKFDKASHYFPGVRLFFELTKSPIEYNVLYHNNGDGTFTDVTDKAGLKGKGWGGDVAVFDYNGDGHLDLFVTNMFGASQLYRNNGDGTFTDVTKDVLGRTSFGAIGCKAFDYNNDGRLDLFVSDMHSDMWLPTSADPRTTPLDLTQKYDKVLGPYPKTSAEKAEEEQKLVDTLKFKYEDVVFGNTLFEAQPSGKFKEVSEQAHAETWWPWSVAVGDFDNDGYEDVFLPSGMGRPWAYWPNVLLMNNGDGTFTDRAAKLGIEPHPGGDNLPDKIGGEPAPKSSRCAAVADFRGIGKLDLVVNNFNDRAYFYKNEFPRKNYIQFRLQGTKSNRDAVGAIVKIHIGKDVMVRQVQAAGGYLSQSSQTLHFGLGDRAKVDKVEIWWPGWPQSRAPQEILDPDINKLHKVVQS